MSQDITKPKSIWRTREVRSIDCMQTPLQELLGPGSLAVRETTTPLKNRTLRRYGVASIIAIREGRSHYILSGHPFAVEAPALLVRPAGGDVTHIGDPSGDCRFSYFCISGPLATSLSPLREQPVPYAYLPDPDPELFETLVRAVDQAFDRERDSNWRLAEYLMCLFRRLTRSIPNLRGNDPDISQRLNDAMESDWSYPRSVTEAAELLGLSRSELYRRFHDEVGQSPAEWIRRQRVELAGHHLKDGLTVSEVADLMNFSSPFALSRMFKSVTGEAPITVKST